MPMQPPRHKPLWKVRSKAETLKQWSRFHQAFHPRPSAATRGYSRDWTKLRDRYIAEHPDCASCGEKAVVVDHVQSIREHPELRLDVRNLRSLCFQCHHEKSMRFENTLGKRRSSPA
jgi:5-methylcytosine-specific restriction endonuclease McrA